MGHLNLSKRLPIAKKLLMMVLTTSAVMSTLLTCAQILFEYSEKKSELNSVIKGIESSLLPGIARLMWDFDLGNIAPPFDNLLNSVDLARVKITNIDGKVILEKSKPDFTPEFPIAVEFPIIYKDNVTTETVGRVQMEFYSDRILKEIRFHFITLLGFNLVKTLIVALILIQLFARVVTKPLTGIVKYLEKSKALPEGAEPSELSINRGSTSPDEISDLIDFVSSREKQVFALQQKLREKIEIQTKELEETDHALKQERIRAEMNARMAQMAEMASGVAHEINNPLAIIGGYLYAIRLTLKKPEHTEAAILKSVDKAEKTTERIAKIVSGLRSFARDASQDPMEMAAINDMVQNTLNLLETKIRGHGVNIELINNCPAGLYINCRATQIIQTMVSLVSNAFDAVKSNENAWIKIHVSTRDRNVVIQVTDSGQGIPDDVSQKIFEPVFTTKQVGQGSGLGLSVGIGIAKDHGGDIHYVKGSANTTFEFVLPIAQERAA